MYIHSFSQSSLWIGEGPPASSGDTDSLLPAASNDIRTYVKVMRKE